jgi:hypothetical protein
VLSSLQTRTELTERQVEGVQWLREHPRGYLADVPGFGKTRQLLVAAGPCRVVVICPAAIRNTEVWPSEAQKIGWDGELDVFSYHEVARGKLRGREWDVVIFDEAHHLKSRKVSWQDDATALAERTERVWLASGTPIPNITAELWAQLKQIKPMPAYWPWVKQWFRLETTMFTQYKVTGRLVQCIPGVCFDRPDKQPDLTDCEHWDTFYEQNLSGHFLRRGYDLLDLPPLTGIETPLWTPMKPKQARVYKAMRKDLLAEVEEGVTLEALSATAKYVQLNWISAGVSCSDPEADPEDKYSGKLDAVTELVHGRDVPSLVGVYYRNTALAAQRVIERTGARVGMFGSGMTPKQQKNMVERFQGGDLDVLVAAISVVKEGITLVAGDQVVLVERHDRPDVNEQTIRRLHRMGQERPVTVRQLVTPNTTNQKQWERLNGKIEHINKPMSRMEIEASL